METKPMPPLPAYTEKKKRKKYIHVFISLYKVFGRKLEKASETGSWLKVAQFSVDLDFLPVQ